MFDNLFGKKKDEEKQVGEDMQKLSDQIGALQQQLAEKTKEADSLRTQASQNLGTAGALEEAQAQLEVLRNQIAEMKQQQKAVGEKPVETRSADTSSAPAAGGVKVGASSAPVAGGLVVGASAWVTRAGGLPLRLRSGPGLDQTQIDRLQPGTQMTLKDGPRQADGHAWWHIRTSDGREGWVAGEDLRDKPD